MKTRFTVIFLFLSGLLLLFIGGSILFAPHSFHAHNGIVLSDDPSLLSEVRAPGGLLAASALLLLFGSLKPSLRAQALQLSVLVYGSFGLARVVAFAADGIPAPGLVGSAFIEWVVAAIGMLLLVGSRSVTTSSANRTQLETTPSAS